MLVTFEPAYEKNLNNGLSSHTALSRGGTTLIGRKSVDHARHNTDSSVLLTSLRLAEIAFTPSRG